MDFDPDAYLKAQAQPATAPAAPAEPAPVPAPAPSASNFSPDAYVDTSVEDAANNPKFDETEYYRQHGKTPEALDFAAKVSQAKEAKPAEPLKAAGSLAKGIGEELGHTAKDIYEGAKSTITGKPFEPKSGLGSFVGGAGKVLTDAMSPNDDPAGTSAGTMMSGNEWLKRTKARMDNYDALLADERMQRDEFLKNGGKPQDFVSNIDPKDVVTPEERAAYDNQARKNLEASAALHLGAFHGANLAIKGYRGLTEWNRKEWTPEQWKDRIAADAELRDTADNLKAGKLPTEGVASMMTPNVPDDVRQRLTKEGTYSPEDVEKMSGVADPTNLLIGEGLRLPGVAQAAGGALRLSGTAAKGIGSIADHLITNGAGKGIALAGGGVAAYKVGEGILHGDFKPVGVALALFGARALLRRGGALVDDAGRELLNPEAFNSGSATAAAQGLAEDAAKGGAANTPFQGALANFTDAGQNMAAASRIGRRAIQGAALGVEGAVPFAALSDNPEQAGHALGGGAAFGGALGPIGGVEAKWDRAMEINKAATSILAERGGAQTFSDPALQKAHDAAMADLPEGYQTYLNAMRGLVSGFRGRAGTPMQIAVLAGPEFGKQVAARSGASPDAASTAYGFYDASSGTVFINKDGLRTRSDAAGHETGHFVTDEVMGQMGRVYGDALRTAVSEGLFNGEKPTPAFQRFIDEYNKRTPGAPIPADKGKGEILNNRAVSEYLAETTRNILGEPNLGKFMLPKDVSDAMADKAVAMFGDQAGDGPKKDIFNRTDLPTIHNALKDVMFDLGRGLTPPARSTGSPRPGATAGAGTPQAVPTATGSAQAATGRPSDPAIPNSVLPETPAEEPNADIGVSGDTLDAVRDYHISPPGMEPRTQRANRRKGIDGKSADKIAEERGNEWDEMFSNYAEWLRTNGLQAPGHPTELHQAVIEHALKSDPVARAHAEAVRASRNTPQPEPAATGALAEPEAASSIKSKSEGALADREPEAAPEVAPERESNTAVTEHEITNRLADAEKEAQADPSFARKRQKGKDAALRTARVNALLDISSESSGGDQGLLQRRTDASGQERFTGRLDPENIPAHRMLLNELGVNKDGQATIDLLNDHVGQTVYLDYKSAPKTTEGDITGKQRRKEYQESTADDRKAGGDHVEQKGKAFHITGFKVWPGRGSITLTGFSPDKWIANAAKLMDHVRQQGQEPGYTGVNDPHLATDMQGYAENHANGYKGDGSAPVEGREPTEGYEPWQIPKDRFNLLNAALNFDVSTRENSGKPGSRENAIDAQIRAGENGVGIDPDSGDVNPLRAYINKSGALVSTNADGKTRTGTGEHLESVYENISPDLVTGLSTTPDGQNIVRPVGFEGDPGDIARQGTPRFDYAASGFMPGSEAEHKVRAASIRLKDGEVIDAPSHSFAYDKANEQGKSLAGVEEGFTLKDGTFIHRDEAYRRFGGSTTEELKAKPPSRPAKGEPTDEELLAALRDDSGGFMPGEDASSIKTKMPERQREIIEEAHSLNTLPKAGTMGALDMRQDFHVNKKVADAMIEWSRAFKANPGEKTEAAFSLWKDSVADFAASLPERQSRDARSGQIADPFQTIKDKFPGGKPKDLADSIRSMYELARDGIGKAALPNMVARDYLNMVELAEQMGEESPGLTKLADELNEKAWGSKKRTSAVLADYADENEGGAMLGESEGTDLQGGGRQYRDKGAFMPRENETQKEYEKRLKDDPASLIEEHRNPAGVPVFNGDAIIYNSPEFRNASKEDAPMIAKKLYPMAKAARDAALDHMVEQPIEGEGDALVMAGGIGSGKSTISKRLKRPEFIYDSNLKDFGDAVRNIDKILASGRTVNLALVERDPADAMRANLERFQKEGRIEYADDVGSSNALARANVKKLAEHYKDNPKVTVEAWKNVRDQDPVKVPLKDVEDISVDDARKAAHDTLNEIEKGTDTKWKGEPLTQEAASIARGASKDSGRGLEASNNRAGGIVDGESEAPGAKAGGSPHGDAAGTPGALSGRDSGAGGRVGRFMPKEASSHDTKSDIDPLGFYSGLSRIIKDKLPNRASGEQIMATLKGAGAKQEEMESMGLPEFLKTHDGPVTKQELQDFVKAGGVQLKEVTKTTGEGDETVPIWNVHDHHGDFVQEFHSEQDAETWKEKQIAKFQEQWEDDMSVVPSEKDGSYIVRDRSGWESDEGFDTKAEAQEHLEEVARENAEDKFFQRYSIRKEDEPNENHKTDTTKFSQYQLPGGENYKEVLLTLPQNKASLEELQEREVLRKKKDLSQPELDRLAFLNGRALGGAHEPNQFRSSHWDEPNVLAHSRQADHVDTEGNKVRLIEEIQSDWHQKGRKEGYNDGGKAKEALKTEYDKLTDDLAHARTEHQAAKKAVEESVPAWRVISYGKEVGAFKTEAEARELQDKLTDENKRGFVRPDPAPDDVIKAESEANKKVQGLRDRIIEINQKFKEPGSNIPDAPFKKTWAELMFKRSLRAAAEDGMDKIAWTPGEVHTGRWGTERIEWKEQGGSSGGADIVLKDGEPAVSKGQWKGLRKLGSFDSAESANSNLEEIAKRWDVPVDSLEVREPNRKFFVTAKQQHGGNAGGIDLEGEANQRGLNAENATAISSREELQEAITPALTEGQDPEALSKKLWDRMQKEREGVSMPRKEGFEGFYDKILPDFVRKYVKKWGGKVETTTLPAKAGEIKGSIEELPNLDGSGSHYVAYGPDGYRTGAAWDTKAEAEAALKEANGLHDGATVHSVTITPEMRKAVLEEGQPMFMPKDKNAPVSQKARERNFKKWTGRAKVIREGDSFDDIKPGEPVVVEGFHGTTHEFDTADPSKGNIENDMGRGFYVTNTSEDVESNYAGEGPDLTNRIDLRAERIDSEIEGMSEGEIVESFGVTAKEAKLLIDGEGYSYGSPQAKERNAILKKIAKSYLTKHGGATMKVFVKMKNPLKLGGKEEYWDSSYPEDDEGEITGDPTGKGIEFLEALRHEASHYDSADLDEDKLYELAMEGGRPSEFIKAAKEAMPDASDPDTGDMASSEIVRAALERMGYDGIIDGTVNQKFGSQSKQKAMAGMHEGTFHVIAFHPEQIKSATGNKGTFDPENPSMNFMPKAKEQAGALSGGGPPSSYHTKRDDEKKRGALAAH